MAFFWLLSVAALLLLAFALFARAGVTPTDAPLTACLCAALVLLAFGFANLLLPGLCLVWAGMLGCGITAAIRCRDRLAAFFLSPPVLAFAAGAVLVGLISTLHGYFYSQFDEYSHWGPYFRLLFAYDRLPVYHDFEVWHPSYPQGVQVFYYLISRPSGAFREADTFTAMGILYSACTAAAMRGLRWQRPLPCVLAILATPLFYVLFPALWPYITVYQDAMLGALFGGALIPAALARDSSPGQMLPAAVGAAFLTQIKATGWMFAMIVLAVYGVRLWLDAPAGTPKRFGRRTAWLAAVGGSAAFWGVWRLLIQITGRAAREFFTPVPADRPPLLELLTSLLRGQGGFAADVLEAMRVNFIRLPVVYNGYGTPRNVILLFGAAGVVFAVYAWRRKARGLALALLAMPAFLAVYCAAVYVSYLTLMMDYEALINASLERYLGSFFIGWALLLLAALLQGADRLPGRLPLGVSAAALAGLCVLQGNILLKTDVLNLHYTPGDAGRTALGAVSDQMRTALQEKDRVWVIGCGLDTIYRYIYYYTMMPAQVDLRLPISHGEGFPENVQELRTALAEERIGYLLVYATDDAFTAAFGSLFSDGLAYVAQNELPCLYRVEADGTFTLLVSTVYGG